MDTTKGKPVKKREKVPKISAVGEINKQKNLDLAAVKVEDVDIKTLSIDDRTTMDIGRLSTSTSSSARLQRGEQLTVNTSSCDATPRSPVLRSRSLPVEDLADKTASVRQFSAAETASDDDDDIENDPGWSLAGRDGKSWHPYRRYSLPVTPVCPRGTEIFPSPRRNSLATTTLRTISQHYELFHTQEKILEEQGEECGDLASPQGLASFQLPNLRPRRQDDTSSASSV